MKDRVLSFVLIFLVGIAFSACTQGGTEKPNDINSDSASITVSTEIEKTGEKAINDVIYDFSIDASNPRNSEGAFIELDDGTLLFAYSKFIESDKDYSKSIIASVSSYDGGKTWTNYNTINTEWNGIRNLMSVSLLKMSNGDVGIFYLARASMDDMTIVMQRSSDNGNTWTKPTACSTRSGYFVVNNDRVLRTIDNRIIIPASEHEAVYNDKGQFRFMTPGRVTFFFSDDDGVTWNEVEKKVEISERISSSGLQEPGIVELADGKLWGWARTDLGRQYEMFSDDGGITWSEAVPSRFTSPRSPMSIKKLSDNRLLAVWNPVPNNNIFPEDKVTKSRSPLVYSISDIYLKSWSEPMIIENDDDSGYCYTAIYDTGDKILLAYCAGSKEDGSCMDRLRIRTLRIEDE